MKDLYRQIIDNIRNIMALILEPQLDLDEFLALVTTAAKELAPAALEARTYEIDFIENLLFLKTSTQLDVEDLSSPERSFTIQPGTITGDAIIENRVIVASRDDGYSGSRFVEGQEFRAAFPIEFFDVEMPEGRTKYVLVVDKAQGGPISDDVLAALKDYSILAGLAISIKELRDTLSQYYERNRNLVLIGRHAAAVAHDLRSLNVGVGGYVKLARRLLQKSDGPVDAEKASEYLSMAEDNARQIEVLLAGLAQFSRASVSLNRDTELVEAVNQKVASLSNRLDFGRLVDFDLEIPERPTGLLVDRDWFGTVLENLVKNSVEACGGPTTLKIRVENHGPDVRLIFEDDCGGVPADRLSDLFVPFQTGKKTGQGLGLANAKKVIEDHGGNISVSNRPGEGASFVISLPGED